MVRLVRDKTKEKRNGSGIIEFTSKADAAEALMEINGRDVEGWKLKLRFYKPLGPQGQNTAPLQEQEVPLQLTRRTGSGIKDFDIWRPLGE